MRQLKDLMSAGDSGVFGPGTDLVVSLAAVLILVLALQSVFQSEDRKAQDRELKEMAQTVTGITQKYEICEREREIVTGGTDLREIKRYQQDTIAAVARQFGMVAQAPERKEVVLDINRDGVNDVYFFNEPTRQRITFGSNILFGPDDIALTDEGGRILRRFSLGLRETIETIQEIQIEGHADMSPTNRYDTNLELGAQRAMTVFWELQRNGISPYKTPMSAASFGEYMSVQRFHSGTPKDYSLIRLVRDNLYEGQKNLNRRIELALVYARRSGDAGSTP